MMFEKMHERRLKMRAVVRSSIRMRVRRRCQQLTRSTAFKLTLATVKVIASICLPVWDLYTVEDKPAKVHKPTGLIEDIPLVGEGEGLRRRRSWESLVSIDAY